MASRGGFTLAEIMDESDDDLSDLELENDVAQALASGGGGDSEVLSPSPTNPIVVPTPIMQNRTQQRPPSISQDSQQSLSPPRRLASVSHRQGTTAPQPQETRTNRQPTEEDIPRKRVATVSKSEERRKPTDRTDRPQPTTKPTPETQTVAPVPMTQSERRRNKHGKVLRSLLLSKMSQHMASPGTQREVGIPTVICVHGFMAIGTSRGFVLVYEANQNPKMILGTVGGGIQTGAVTSISSNYDNTRLLVGHEQGQVVRWDLTTGKQLNTITIHPKGCAITGLAFTDDHTGALSNDAKGYVFVHTFKRVMGVRTVDSTVMWNGKKDGEVCLMQVLQYPPGVEGPAYTTVALGQLSQIVIVQLRPELKIALRIARNTADGDQIPSLSWNFVPIKISEDLMTLDPMLAFGWGKSVRFMQLQTRGDKPTIFTTLGTYHSKVPIITIRWLSDRVIMTMDRQERVHVIDVSAMMLVDIVDLTRVQLTFNDKFSVAQCKLGKRDPNAPSLKAYDQSIASISGNIYLLGMNSVHLLNILTWQERITFLTSQNKFVAALELAFSFYEDKALAVAAMPKSKQQRKTVCRQKLLNLLQAYAGLTLKRQQQPRGAEYFMGVGQLCIQYCYMLDAKDLLFGTIYSSFSSNPISKGAFLDLLEPMILDNKIKTLSPVVMQDLVEHHQQAGTLRKLEECVMRLDVRNLDLHQFVVLCWTHGLYDAMIYVYNRGLNDFTTPLKELLNLLASSIKSMKTRLGGKAGNVAPLLSKDHQALGYKLLLYTSFCLSGKAFPVGDIAPANVNRVKWEVYHNIVAREGSPSFPYIRTLVQFDTREFLNVLSLAFEEPEAGRQGDTKSLPRQQVVVDRLLEIMVTEPQREGVSMYSPEQVGQLFTFLARQMARYKQIHVEQRMFDQVLDYLSNPEDTTQHEERQQALLELLNMNKNPWGPFSDPNRLLQLANQAQFYRVMQLIYERKAEHHKILECYLLDKGRQSQVFSFIHHTLKNTAIKQTERSRIRELVVVEIARLTRIDNNATARLLLMDFRKVVKPIVLTLNSQEQVQYSLLQGIFNVAETLDDEELEIAPEVHERYVELLCKISPAKVYPYLREASEYRINECLELARKYRVTDATAWLLEQKGDLPGAYALIHGTLLEKMKLYNQAYINYEKAMSSGSEFKDDRPACLQRLRGILAVAMQMCLRATDKLNESGREGLWFPLLDALINSQRAMKQALTTTVNEYAVIFQELMRHVVNSMINYVALPAILQKVMADGSLTRSFGEVKDLIMGMVDTYAYENTLLETTNRIVANDLYWAMRMRMDATRKGVRHRAKRQTGELEMSTDLKYAAQHQSLLRLERESETPRFQQMLEELEAFRHNEGPPPMPLHAMCREPDFALKTSGPIPPSRPSKPRPEFQEVPAEPESGVLVLDDAIRNLLSTAR
eukprot:m.227446 g.227446  ORF g.227446 m.227446 type:complete len:1426 (-) comp33521_c0_seq2:201-4478(-)